MQEGGTSPRCMDGMDSRFDGHRWCKSNNISMSKLSFGVKCHKVFCAQNLLCANETYAYKVKYKVQNR